FRSLVEALQHADLGNVREAQQAIGRGVVEFGAVQQAAVECRYDFTTRQRVNCGTHSGEEVNGQTVGTELQALQVFDLGDRLLEPAERLSWHGAVQNGDDVNTDGLVEFVEQFFTATVLVPGQQHVGVHTECRTGREQGQR